MNEKIDFVIIWVDGGDAEWRKEKNKYAGIPNEETNGDARFRDWDNLKYWFRGVEKFAPWVDNIYFVTCGHYPKWLNLNHPKLKFVKHDEYIPKEYLPTFSSHTIELNLHRIKGLSEKIVYFNDDMFLISPVQKSDFFENEKPRYVLQHEVFVPNQDNDFFQHIIINNMTIINKYFDKSTSIKKNFGKWFSFKNSFKYNAKNILLLPWKKFSCFIDTHTPSPLLKSTMEELWNKEFSILDKTSKDKFRQMDGVNQYLFKNYDIARGNFEVTSAKDFEYYDVKEDNTKLIDTIINQSKKIICVNDTTNKFDFETAKKEINDAFEKILPDKSEFEI